MSKPIDYTGVRYHKLVGVKLLKMIVRPHDLSRCNAQWLWQCDCGQQVESLARHVKRGFKKSCGCHVRRGWKVVAWNVYNKCYADGDLTFEKFCELSQQPCHYCGTSKYNCRNYHGNQWKYNGLDRINNNKKHTLNNVVPSCWDCNERKSNWTYKKFMGWIKRIYKNRIGETNV